MRIWVYKSLPVVLLCALGAACPRQNPSPTVTLHTPPDTLWIAPLGTHWIVERSVRGLAVPIYPANGLAAPVLLTLDGTVVVSPVADSYECGGYYPLPALIEPQLGELPLPPAGFRDLQRYAALSGAGLWLWTWRLEDYEPLASANHQTRWLLPDNWVSDRAASSPFGGRQGGGSSNSSKSVGGPGGGAVGAATRPAEPYLPIVSPRLPKLSGIPAANLAALATWFEIAGDEPRKFLADDPLAGMPYAHLPALQPHPYLFPLKASRYGQLPSSALPLQDRVSLAGPMGRLVAFSTIALEGRQSGARYNELYGLAMASNVSPLGRTNALLAIGTIPDSRQATLLMSCLRECEPKIAEAAAYMIGLSGLHEAETSLREARKNRPELRDVTAWALARLESLETCRELVRKFNGAGMSEPCPLSAHELLAMGSLLHRYLGEVNSQTNGANLETLTYLAGNHPDPAIRRAAVLTLVRIADPKSVSQLGALLARNLIEPTEMPAVVSRLASAGPAGIGMLLAAWPAGSPMTRSAISLGVQFAEDKEQTSAVLADRLRASYSTPDERQAAIYLLSRLPKTAPAVAALSSAPPPFRPEAAVVLKLWNEPLPGDWPPACLALTPEEVAKRRMSAPSASQPASAPTKP